MAWTDYYMQTTGSNLNAGSTSADAAVFTSTAGNWDGTSIFTPTTGATTSTLVSVGDWASIYPTGNTTTPYVAQVTAVGAGVNGTITLSTTAKFGTAPTSNSGSRNCKTGGAWADFGMVASGVALATGTVNSSTRINVKAGTYANTTTTRTFALAGTATADLWWRGYKATPGDQDTIPIVASVAGTDIPGLTFTTGQMVISSSNQIFSSLDINSACTTANGAVSISGGNVQLFRTRIQNTAANAAARAATISGTGFAGAGLYLKATSTAGVVVFLTGAQAEFHGGSTFVGSAGSGLSIATGAHCYIGFCVFDSTGGNAISVAASTNVQIIHCAIFSPTGNGVEFSATPTYSIVAGCYFEGVNQASKAAINNTSGTNTNQVRCVGNAGFNCTAYLSGITESFAVFDNGILAGPAFNAPKAHDFSVGAIAEGLGFPGPFENISAYRGSLDVGAVQRPKPRRYRGRRGT